MYYECPGAARYSEVTVSPHHPLTCLSSRQTAEGLLWRWSTVYTELICWRTSLSIHFMATNVSATGKLIEPLRTAKHQSNRLTIAWHPLSTP